MSFVGLRSGSAGGVSFVSSSSGRVRLVEARQARSGGFWCISVWQVGVGQARYGYYGSLWCGELQLKVPTLMIVFVIKGRCSPRISRGLFLFKSMI